MADTPNNAPQGAGNTAEGQEKTFTQAEVDQMIGQRLSRERSKYPSEEELTAYNNWKATNQTEQQKAAQRERDLTKAQTDLAAAQSEVEQLKRERYVLSKGLSGDEAEFIAYKAAKMVDNKTTFEQAVDKLTENRQKVTFDWTAPAGGNGQKNDVNAVMNRLIRGAMN